MQGCLRLFLLISVVFAVACSASPLAGRAPASTGPMEFALDKLRAAGGSESFLELLQSVYREDQRLRVLDLNLLGFLRMRPEQEDRIPGWELQRVERFLRQYRTAFSEAEKQFPVPKEVIASLLWVETKYGRDIGTFHVASAYLSLAQADYPTILDQTLDLARERVPELSPEMEARVLQRSKARSEWAVKELIALQEVHERGFKDAKVLEGSFAGAFGMAQFIPSSYLSWAKGRRRQADLFRADDSIFSVANYLTENGWKRNDRKEQEAALFHYNRDRRYVERILRMGDCLREPAKLRQWKGKKGPSSC